MADDIYNTIVSADKVMVLDVGADGVTTLGVKPQNEDEKAGEGDNAANGCNMKSGTFTVKINSSDTTVATVTPGEMTFTNCGENYPVTVNARAAGSATITLTAMSNTTPGTFNLVPATFTVNVTKAAPSKSPTSVSLNCPASVVYSGLAQEPCDATVSGDGLPADAAATLVYTDNVIVGTASVVATYAGDATHESSSAEATFEITQAPSTVTLTCTDPVWFTGSPIEPCSARVTGAGGLDEPVSVSYDNNTMPGTATATATYPGDWNHTGSSKSVQFTIKGYDLYGFYKPIDMDKVNIVKAGSTVPLKFEVFLNGVEQTDTAVIDGFTVTPFACNAGDPTTDSTFGTTGGTSLRYDAAGGQFIQNWQTPKKAGACYTVTMTTIDGGTISADFKLK
jgi:hypothetical protein